MSLLTQILLSTFFMLFLATSGMWLLSVVRRDASIADPFWPTGFVIVAWLSWWLQSGDNHAPLLLAALVTIWGARLATHLLLRNASSGEDRRYRALRRRAGQRFWWTSLFSVFYLQGGLLWFISLPIQAAAARNETHVITSLSYCGILLWSAGFFCEAVSDWQLARFTSRPENAGRVFDRGLWRFTRHPNYFGDACVWWGLYLIAAAGGAWLTVASPLVMTFLLMRVSGVTLLETTISDRRPDYAAYQASTNAFFPGHPRRAAQP